MKKTTIFFWLGLLTLAGAIAASLVSHEAAIAAWVVGTTLLLLSLLTGGIRSLKFSTEGIEATVEEVKQIATDAHQTLEQARRLTLALGKFLVWQKAGAGRWDGPGASAVETGDRLLRQIAEAAGLTAAEYAEMQSAEFPFIRFDYESFVTDAAATGKSWSSEQEAAWNAHFRGPHRRGPGTEDSPSQLRAFLSQYGFVDEEVEERLKDYEHWDVTRQHRRPDTWRKFFKL
jgi:hypothetical protein